MYRKDTSQDGGYYRPLAFQQAKDCNSDMYTPQNSRSSNSISTERTSSSFGSDNKKRDYSYKGRSFVNSNWRKPQQQPWTSDAMPGYSCRSNADDQATALKKSSAVDNLIPHFCVRSELKPKPDVEASENKPYRPEALSNERQGKEKILGRDDRFENHHAQSSKSPNITPDSGSWRNSATIPWSVRRKITHNVDLSDGEIKSLSKPESLKNVLRSWYTFNEVVLKLDRETEQVKANEWEREEVARQHLEEEMKTIFENCKVIPYSTRVLGMAHSKSSMYLFFDAGNSYNGNVAHDKATQERIRKAVFEKMSHCGHCSDVRNWDVQELVTFEHTDSKMRCVISVDSGMKHRNTLLIRTFVSLDNRVRMLMLFVTDMVFRYHDLSKFFTSYMLQIMTIMYLQRIPEPILPTLQLLRKTLPSDRIFIKGCDCSFPYDVASYPKTNNCQSLAELLLGFCSFYIDFDWEEDIISILGPHLKRSMFRNPHEVPTNLEPPLSSYFESLCWDDHAVKMNCDLPIVVQDPLELGVNVAEKVNATVLKIFEMMCSDARELLSKWV